MAIVFDSTDQRVVIRVLDASTGLPHEGLAYNASGIEFWYQRIGGTKTAISLASGTGLNATHSDGKWNEIDNGLYQVDSPDAAFASGAVSVLFGGGATGYVFIPTEIALISAPATASQATAIENDTQDIQSRLPSALVSGRMDSSVEFMSPNTLTASALATDAVTEIQSGLATAANLSTVASYLDTEIAAILADTNELQTDWANGGRLDSILDATATATALSSLITTVGAAGAGLTEAGGTGDHLTAIPWNASWDAEVQSEVQDAIVVNGLDHLLAASVSSGDVTDNSVFARIASKSITASWASFDHTTDSLQAIKDTALTASAVNTEVDTALTDIHLDHLLAADYDPGNKPGVSTALLNELIGSDAGVSQFTANALELAPSGGGSLTVADIADGVWDEVLSGHATAGTTGAALAAAQSAGDPWATALPGAYASGTAGNIIGNRLDAAVSSIETEVILAPVAGNAPDRVEDTTLKAFIGETWSEQVGGLDANGAVINFTTLGDLEFILENNLGVDVVVIANASITKATTYFQVTIADTYIGTVATTMKWALRQTSNNNVVLHGPFIVGYAANAD